MSSDRILLVEDSKFQARITMDILIKNGYDVFTVESAEEAMKLNIYGSFDLVLLDVLLPGINGYDFCEIIKQKNSLIPVIMLTSMEDEKSVLKALNSGADDYIKKPFNVDELLARIRVQLRTRKLQMELLKKNGELQEAYNTIKKLAITDMLTGAYNRSFIKEYMANLVEKCNSNAFDMGCIMLDIDNFKLVNDTYGHLTGDIVLENVADICRQQVKESGAAIRFGGEEFLILIHGNSTNNIEDITEGIRHRCENSRCCELNFTVSLGAGIFKIHRDSSLQDLQEAIKVADKMLYISKNTGKNKATIRNPHTA